MGSPLSRGELLGPVETVAPRLLGWSIETAEVAIRVTEVEAYGGEGVDPASHAYRGPTPRTQVMFGPPGFAYVYFSYGMHWCLNVVTGQRGEASAVLLRAGEVTRGLDVARSRRVAARRSSDLARGPARLCAALGLDGASTGLDLFEPTASVRLIPANLVEQPVASGPRVGVSQAADVPWRFWIAGEPSVSDYRPSPRLAPQ